MSLTFDQKKRIVEEFINNPPKKKKKEKVIVSLYRVLRRTLSIITTPLLLLKYLWYTWYRLGWYCCYIIVIWAHSPCSTCCYWSTPSRLWYFFHIALIGRKHFKNGILQSPPNSIVRLCTNGNSQPARILRCISFWRPSRGCWCFSILLWLSAKGYDGPIYR